METWYGISVRGSNSFRCFLVHHERSKGSVPDAALRASVPRVLLRVGIPAPLETNYKKPEALPHGLFLFTGYRRLLSI